MGKLSNDARQIEENFKEIESSIAEAAIASGRRSEDVHLVGVTKTVEPARINAAIAAGLRCIGENRVQEYLEKKDALHLDGVRTHLIGHLQTNKVARVVGQVDAIESVDRLRLGKAIHTASQKQGCVTDVLVQVNIGKEATKSGVAEEELEELLQNLSPLSGIRVRGLMTIPPILDTERERRAIFSHMFKLFVDIGSKNIDNIFMDMLSMGMSSDYREAILEGATLVRIGSALFGERG